MALLYSFPNLEPVSYSMTCSKCCFLTLRFLRKQVRWSDTPISLRIFQFVVIHTLKGFSIVNETEDVFLEFPCFLHDPMNVGNLIFGSSSFTKYSLYIYKLLVHVLLKPSLKDFEHILASM